MITLETDLNLLYNITMILSRLQSITRVLRQINLIKVKNTGKPINLANIDKL